MTHDLSLILCTVNTLYTMLDRVTTNQTYSQNDFRMTCTADANTAEMYVYLLMLPISIFVFSCYHLYKKLTLLRKPLHDENKQNKSTLFFSRVFMLAVPSFIVTMPGRYVKTLCTDVYVLGMNLVYSSKN